jgi:hypothetical protein
MKTKSSILGLGLALMGIVLSALLVSRCNLTGEQTAPPPTRVLVYIDVTATPTRPAPTSKIPTATPTRERPDVAITIRAPQTIQGSGRILTEQRRVRNFDRVYLTSFGDLFITQGEQESLTVKADDNLMPYIETQVENGTLRLNNPVPNGSVEFHLSVKEITGLGATGVGDIHWTSLDLDHLEFVISGVGDIGGWSLDTDRLEISIDGAGDVNVNSLTADELVIYSAGAGEIDIGSLTAEELVAYLSGAGDVHLAGQVVEQGIFLGGANDYHAARLKSQTAIIEAGGAGTVTVWVTDTLDVQVSGPTTVKYYGFPQVTKDISTYGRLISLGSP